MSDPFEPADSEPRNMTDADVDAFVLALRRRLVADFYSGVGRSVWAWFLRAIAAAGIALLGFALAHGGGSSSSVKP